jgi:two-component system response regulator HydG
VKLLRVLDEHKIERLGSVRSIPLDIRIVAATNRDLQKAIAEGQFREDLYYRLNVISIRLPSLAERVGDVLLLAEKFVERYARKIGKPIDGIDEDAASALAGYPWPGNVRELENVIERAIVLTRTRYITRADLVGLTSYKSGGGKVLRSMADVEKEHILNSLSELGWNIGQTADQLGIHRNTLRTKIKEYGLERPS